MWCSSSELAKGLRRCYSSASSSAAALGSLKVLSPCSPLHLLRAIAAGAAGRRQDRACCRGGGCAVPGATDCAEICTGMEQKSFQSACCVPTACLFRLLILHAMICQRQVSRRLFASLQDDRAALRQPIFQVNQLCCTAILTDPAAVYFQCPAAVVTAAVIQCGTQKPDCRIAWCRSGTLWRLACTWPLCWGCAAGGLRQSGKHVRRAQSGETGFCLAGCRPVLKGPPHYSSAAAAAIWQA